MKNKISLFDTEFAQSNALSHGANTTLRYLTDNRRIVMSDSDISTIYNTRTLATTPASIIVSALLSEGLTSEIVLIDTGESPQGLPELLSINDLTLDMKQVPGATSIMSSLKEYQNKVIINMATYSKRSREGSVRITDLNGFHLAVARAALVSSYQNCSSDTWLNPTLVKFIAQTYASTLVRPIVTHYRLSVPEQLVVTSILTYFVLGRMSDLEDELIMQCDFLGNRVSIKLMIDRFKDIIGTDKKAFTLSRMCDLIVACGPDHMKNFNIDIFKRMVGRVGASFISSNIALEYPPYWVYQLVYTMSDNKTYLNSLLQQTKLLKPTMMFMTNLVSSRQFIPSVRSTVKGTASLDLFSDFDNTENFNLDHTDTVDGFGMTSGEEGLGLILIGTLGVLAGIGYISNKIEQHKDNATLQKLLPLIKEYEPLMQKSYGNYVKACKLANTVAKDINSLDSQIKIAKKSKRYITSNVESDDMLDEKSFVEQVAKHIVAAVRDTRTNDFKNNSLYLTAQSPLQVTVDYESIYADLDQDGSYESVGAGSKDADAIIVDIVTKIQSIARRYSTNDVIYDFSELPERNWTRINLNTFVSKDDITKLITEIKNVKKSTESLDFDTDTIDSAINTRTEDGSIIMDQAVGRLYFDGYHLESFDNVAIPSFQRKLVYKKINYEFDKDAKEPNLTLNQIQATQRIVNYGGILDTLSLDFDTQQYSLDRVDVYMDGTVFFHVDTNSIKKIAISNCSSMKIDSFVEKVIPYKKNVDTFGNESYKLRLQPASESFVLTGIVIMGIVAFLFQTLFKKKRQMSDEISKKIKEMLKPLAEDIGKAYIDYRNVVLNVRKISEELTAAGIEHKKYHLFDMMSLKEFVGHAHSVMSSDNVANKQVKNGMVLLGHQQRMFQINSRNLKGVDAICKKYSTSLTFLDGAMLNNSVFVVVTPSSGIKEQELSKILLEINKIKESYRTAGEKEEQDQVIGAISFKEDKWTAVDKLRITNPNGSLATCVVHFTDDDKNGITDGHRKTFKFLKSNPNFVKSHFDLHKFELFMQDFDIETPSKTVAAQLQMKTVYINPNGSLFIYTTGPGDVADLDIVIYSHKDLRSVDFDYGSGGNDFLSIADESLDISMYEPAVNNKPAEESLLGINLFETKITMDNIQLVFNDDNLLEYETPSMEFSITETARNVWKWIVDKIMMIYDKICEFLIKVRDFFSPKKLDSQFEELKTLSPDNEEHVKKILDEINEHINEKKVSVLNPAIFSKLMLSFSKFFELTKSYCSSNYDKLNHAAANAASAEITQLWTDNTSADDDLFLQLVNGKTVKSLEQEVTLSQLIEMTTGTRAQISVDNIYTVYKNLYAQLDSAISTLKREQSSIIDRLGNVVSSPGGGMSTAIKAGIKAVVKLNNISAELLVSAKMRLTREVSLYNDVLKNIVMSLKKIIDVDKQDDIILTMDEVSELGRELQSLSPFLVLDGYKAYRYSDFYAVIKKHLGPFNELTTICDSQINAFAYQIPGAINNYIIITNAACNAPAWVSSAIIAHEIGHIVKGHNALTIEKLATRDPKSKLVRAIMAGMWRSPKAEIEADMYCYEKYGKETTLKVLRYIRPGYGMRLLEKLSLIVARFLKRHGSQTMKESIDAAAPIIPKENDLDTRIRYFENKK